jgi:hypothetical protein
LQIPNHVVSGAREDHQQTAVFAFQDYRRVQRLSASAAVLFFLKMEVTWSNEADCFGLLDVNSKAAFRREGKSLYRITTREKKNGHQYEIANGDDLDAIHNGQVFCFCVCLFAL